MGAINLLVLLLLIANVVFSYKGFRSTAFFYKYNFQVEKVLLFKEYHRIITSGFLHVGWVHLIFNMIGLLAFGGVIEEYLGVVGFLLVYFAGLIGGELLSLFIHRLDGSYSSVGASGAVCSLIFAAIALFPGMGIGFFGLPFSIPAWFYGLVYVLYSIYGIRSRQGNIGHDAHLGGALIGMLVALLFEPAAFGRNYLTILLIALPCLVFIYLIISKPHFLLVANKAERSKTQYYSIDHRYNADKRERQLEVDRILDKISRRGMSSLSEKEKQILKEYSQTIK